MGMDNITCPSKAPVAGCAVGVPASVRTRGFGPQLAAARCELRSGIQIAWVARQRRRHGGMRVIDCPGKRRVREGAADKAATQLVRVQPRQLSMSDVKRRHIPVRVTGRAMRGVKGPAAFALLRWEQPGGRASVGARR